MAEDSPSPLRPSPPHWEDDCVIRDGTFTGPIPSADRHLAVNVVSFVGFTPHITPPSGDITV